MRSARLMLLFVVLLAVSVPLFAVGSTTKDELVAIAMEIDNAIEPGDKAVFAKYLTDDFILVDRDGLRTLTKKDVVEGTTPIPKGYWLKFEIADVELREFGDVAVLIFKTIEREGVHDQEILVNYRGTDVFVKRDGEWKLAVWQYVELQRDAEPTKVNPAKYDALAGSYVMGPGIKYNVTRRGEKLFGAREGRPEEELVPESDDVFYVPGTEFRRIFVKDDSGRVLEMLGRRKGTDIRWKRVDDAKPAATPAR